MRKTLAIATAVAADAIRRKVVWAVLLFAGVLALAVPSLPTYGVGVDLAVFREVSIALTWLAAVIVTLAIGAGRIPTEIERRTLYSVLGRDVRRWQYLLGTWMGVMIVMAAVIAAFALVTIGVGLIRYGAPQVRLFEAALAIWLECGVLAAFVVAISTAIGAFVTVVAAIVFLFVGHSYRSLLGPSASSLIPSLDVFNVINPVAHGSGIGLLYAAIMVGAAVAWVAVLLLLGTLLFDRRDL